MCECNHVLCVGEGGRKGGRDGGRTRGVPGLGELHVLSHLPVDSTPSGAFRQCLQVSSLRPYFLPEPESFDFS